MPQTLQELLHGVTPEMADEPEVYTRAGGLSCVRRTVSSCQARTCTRRKVVADKIKR